MAILTLNCPSCGRTAKIQSQFSAMNLIHYVYQCGHMEVRPATLVGETKDQTSPIPAGPSSNGHIDQTDIDYEIQRMISEGYQSYADTRKESDVWYSVNSTKKAYDFQKAGVRFCESALPTFGGVLIADAMGLGKTIQSLLLLKRHWAALTPCAVLVKGGTTFQWAHEFGEWISEKLSDCIPCTSRTHLIKGFKCYIISMDLISRKGVVELINKLGLKSLIIDECQNFKDRGAERSKALHRIIKENNIEFKIALSGTPIKNRVSEYFTILNILDPRTFHEYTRFQRRWLMMNEKGIYTKLNPYMIDEFTATTSRYIIRREKHEVLKDLPPLTRDYQYIEIDDPLVKKSYNQEVDLLKNYLNTASRIDSTSLLGWLARMRAITGSAKCSYAVDWTQNFLDSTDDSLAVGIHHKSVRDTLHYVFTKRGITTAKLSGEDNAYEKSRIQNAFNTGQNRLLIINMLAGGIGLNLQSCSNTLVLELPWNPADMEQFISRFHRDGQKKPVIATYLIAKNTIDEFMFDLIYKKSALSTQAGIKIAPFAESEDPTQNPEFLKEFAEFVADHKL